MLRLVAPRSLAQRGRATELWSTAARALSTAAEPYDVVVVGGGPGGYPAAIKAGQLSAPPLRCANSTKLPLPAKARAERPWSARIERLHPRLNRVFSASWRP